MTDNKLAAITTAIFLTVLIYFGWFVYHFGVTGIFFAFGPILVVVLLGMLWVMIYNLVEEWYNE